MKNKIILMRIPLIMIVLLILIFCGCNKDNQEPNELKDIDGNLYNTVTIGTQVWMAENLRTTQFRNGDSIPKVTDDAEWNQTYVGLCYYNNSTSNSNKYGCLYNYNTISDDRGIAPVGWHVPSIAEWGVLISYLGGESVAGGKLKEYGTTSWYNPNTGANNGSGFTARPGGYRYKDGLFEGGGFYSGWWALPSSFPFHPWSVSLNYNDTKVLFINDTWKENYGRSVRCIKD